MKRIIFDGVPEEIQDEIIRRVAPDNSAIPKDWPVQSVEPDGSNPNLATCGTCGRTWDDSVSTSMTPTPSGRCPFEYFHSEVPDA